MTEVFFEFFVEYWWWIGLVANVTIFEISSRKSDRIISVKYWARLICVSSCVCIIFLCGTIVGPKDSYKKGFDEGSKWACEDINKQLAEDGLKFEFVVENIKKQGE